MYYQIIDIGTIAIFILDVIYLFDINNIYMVIISLKKNYHSYLLEILFIQIVLLFMQIFASTVGSTFDNDIYC